MRRIALLIISLSALFSLAAQSGGQVVKGRILDDQSEQALIGVAVELLLTDAAEPIGTTTDIDGYFRLENVPLGRQKFRFTYLGYESLTIPNVVVTAGKEVVLNLALSESITELDAVVVTREVAKDRAQNEMATVSARTFGVEEVQRYSGGGNDVARLASNFAGVATADDSRNDIVIRGNSPTGVLWRLEGIPIPNPNHFSTLGTTGGPVSSVNPNLLANSDFMTSAFPAEYGNATAGVFDLAMRNGNRDRHEFTLQLSAFSGLEAMAEGPVGNGSYLVAGRYSFVGLANQAGLDVGTNAIPNYQDLSFKLDLGNGKAGRFVLFGIGGRSDIDFLHDEVDEGDLFAASDEDAFVRSSFGVVGLRHNLILNPKTYLRTVVAVSGSENTFDADRYYNEGTAEEVIVPFTTVRNTETRVSVSSFVNKKYNARLSARAGVLAERFVFDLDSQDASFGADIDGDGFPEKETIYQFDEGTTLVQPYAQARYRLNEQWTLNAGLHGQLLTLTEDFVVEPRLAVNWDFAPGKRFTLGYGLHHQTQPLPIQLATQTDAAGNLTRPNADLGFTRSQHFVLGYDWRLAPDWRLKAETYYQAIDRVPVEAAPTSFSTLNTGADFVFPIDKFGLLNEGTGSNYGVELTLEKFFSRGYYTLLTGSLFNSRYEGSDGVERNTAFNNQYVLNVLAGKEWGLGKNDRNALTLDLRLSTAGGRYVTPVDLEASRQLGREVRFEDRAFSEQLDPYFRFDAKFGVRINSAKRRISHRFFLDIQNVFNNENVFTRTYNRQTNQVNETFQRGFFPDFLYRLQF